MTKFDQCLYSILSKSNNIPKDQNSINRFNDIINTLSGDKSTDDKADELYKYFNSEQIDISKLRKDVLNNMNGLLFSENEELSNKLTTIFSNLQPINDDDNTKSVLRKLIPYAEQNNSLKVNQDDLYKLESSDDDTINNFITSYNNMVNEKTISSILTFISNSKLYNMFNHTKEFTEFDVIPNVANAINNTDISQMFKSEDYIDSYIDVRNSDNDGELKMNMHELSYSDQITDDSVEDSDTETSIYDLFLKQSLKMKKSDKNPVPTDTTNVQSFLDSFQLGDNVDKVRSQITQDIYDAWNVKLIQVYNNCVNTIKNYLPFFKEFHDLNTDDELIEFYNRYFEGQGTELTLPETENDDKNLLLSAVNKKNVFKATLTDFIDKVINDVEKEHKMIAQEQYNKWGTGIKTIIDNVGVAYSSAKKDNDNINTLLNSNITLTSDKKNTISLQSLLLTLGNDKNISSLQKQNVKSEEWGLSESSDDINNVLDGIVHDIKYISRTMRADNTEQLKESCNVDAFINAIKEIDQSNFSIEKITEMGKNTEIFEKECSSYIVINTLYNVFSNVNDSNEFLIVLYTVLLPNNFLK